MVKIRSDNGSEFRNTRVEEYCDGEGIKHEFSSTYTPQQNGAVERKNTTLITLARAMLDDYGVSKVLGGSYQHGMSCFKWSVSPPTHDEDSI
jgi:transposase InsO family protein